MFKKTKIAAVSAAVLGLSSVSAHAISLNQSGSQGQVLIFPYYNVNNDFTTSFNITNTTNETKAVKVRFRESENSNDVLDYNLYMSPYDVFTVGLIGDEDGVRMLTTDKSCTHPTIPATGVLFKHGVYASTDINDVKEGYLEIIEMGVVTDAVVQAGVLHGVSNGTPANCGVIEAAWRNGTFTQGGASSNTRAIDVVNSDAPTYPNTASEVGYYGASAVAGLSAPTGGLVGSSIFVDVANVAGFVTEPLSIVDYSTTAQHYLSSDNNFYLLPSLASGSVTTVETRSGPLTFPTVARDFGMDDIEVLPRTSVPSGINPLPITQAMLVSQIGNQYFLGEGVTTDWVMSAPMRKHGIYNDYNYVATSAGYLDGADIPVAGDPINGYWKLGNDTDVSAILMYWNREEGESTVLPGDFSPPEPTERATIALNREVNILALSATDSVADSVLGSTFAKGAELDAGFTDGWAAFTFLTYDLAGTRYAAWAPGITATSATIGVPMFGFMAARATGDNGSIGETFPHFYGKQ